MNDYAPSSSFLKQRILDQAIAVAMASQGPTRVGAILLKNNKVIAAACNNYTKSDPYQYRISKHASIVYNQPEYSKRIFGHAETLVLKKIKKTLPDSIIVCRLSGKHNSKKLRLARPCKICSHLIKNFYPTIRHIHYSTEKGFLYEHWTLL
jgi:tRNA(Arg) A34 adenosine deaminase TadA